MKPKLEYASRGAAVTELQAKLNLHLAGQAPALVLDGVYGSNTLKRVKQFQLSRGLTADGIVGAKTWAALDGASAIPPGKVPPPPKNPQQMGKRVGLGARMCCSYGSGLSSLLFQTQDRNVATVSDHCAYVNILPFGKCHSVHNPGVYSKEPWTLAVFTPCHCQPMIIRPWSPGVPIEKVGSPPQMALDMTSVTICGYGGVITFVKSGK